ncbi:MAG: MFS transporter [Dehalococcoidia bacterium]
MRRLRIYYGWVIVAGLSLVGAVNMSLGGVNFGSFISPMRNDLGISNTVFGLSATVRTLSTGIFSPYLGKMLDRHGSRYPMAIAGVLIIFILFGLAFVQSGWMLLLMMFLLGAIGMQGGTSLYSTVPISHWFIRKRGMAMSWAFVGGPFALILALPGTAWLIDLIGWRETWALLGVIGGVTTLLVALLIVRNTPQEMGLVADGFVEDVAPVKTSDTAKPAPVEDDEYPWTRDEALRTWAFWALGLSFGVAQLGAGTFVLFRIPFYEEAGISPALAGLGSAVDAGIVAIGVMFLAPHIDRVPLRHGSVVGVGLTMVALAMSLLHASVFMMFFANFVFGVGQIFNIGIRNLIWSTYYGRAHIGSIRGAAFLVQMVFSAAGPPLGGILRDVSGSYDLVWILSLVPMGFGMVLVFTAKKPVPKSRPQSVSEPVPA